MRFLSFLFVLFGISFSANSAVTLYTPQQALKDALSEPLTFEGSYISKFSESGLYPDCIFKNSKVIVISAYCVKEDVPAAGLKILSTNPKKGYVGMYAEMEHFGDDISLATRAQYADFAFNTYVVISPRPYSHSMSAKQIQNWTETERGSYYENFCVTSLRLENFPNSTSCTALDGSQWSKSAFKFWKKSDSNFSRLLKTLKAQVP